MFIYQKKAHLPVKSVHVIFIFLCVSFLYKGGLFDENQPLPDDLEEEEHGHDHIYEDIKGRKYNVHTNAGEGGTGA